jgi:hypothetical protein
VLFYDKKTIISGGSSMSLEEKIIEQVHKLPEDKKAEVQ